MTDYGYDEFGRLELVDHPDGGRVTTDYFDGIFPRCVLTKTKEDLSGSTIDRYDYFDGLNRRIQTITLGEGANTIVTTYRYDNMGRQDRVDGPFFSTLIGHPLTPPADRSYAETNYDYRGRPLKVQTPLGQDVDQGTIAETLYSYSGFSTTITDPDGGKKTEKRDHLGRIIQVVEYGDTQEIYTDYEYNSVGDLLSVTNHLGHATSIVYDTLSRKINMSDPDMGYWQYTYDANNNLKTQTDAKTDAKAQIITFGYDALNRVISKSYSSGDPTVTYTYDEPSTPNGMGRLYRVQNANASTTIDDYDAMGRQKSVMRNITGAPGNPYTTDYIYDLSGKVTRMVYPDITSYQVNYTYHPGTGLLHTVEGNTIESYTPNGKIGYIYHEGNGTATTYSYDARSTRLLLIRTLDPHMDDIQEKAYKYTAAGDILQKIDTGGARNITYTYSYDKLHRLISETGTGGSDNFNAVILNKTFDDNAPVHAPKAVVMGGVQYDYGYDANGNMTNCWDFSDPTQVASRTITYNADNMPVSISHVRGGNTKNVDLFYDGDGVRVKKAVQGGNTTYYIGNHFEVAGGQEIKYIFAGNLRIAKATDTGQHLFHKDHLGSSTVMTDSPNGAVVETSEYLPFGLTRDHTGSEVSAYKFTDQELDAEVGLYNYNARLYDPAVGIFISPDSIVPGWYDPQSLNRYSYVRNNPLIYVDPTGNMFWGAEINSVAVSYGPFGYTSFEGTVYSMGRDEKGEHVAKGQHVAVNIKGFMLGASASPSPAEVSYSVDLFTDNNEDEINPYAIVGIASKGSIGITDPLDPANTLEIGVTILGDLISINEALEPVQGPTVGFGAKGQFGFVTTAGDPYGVTTVDHIIEALAPQDPQPEPSPSKGGYMDIGDFEGDSDTDFGYW